MTTCNHSKATTPFCPYCGTRLHVGALQHLLSFVQNHVVKSEARLNECRQLLSESEGNNFVIDRRKTQLKIAETNAEKWMSWHNALQHVIDQQSENQADCESDDD